MIRIIYDFEVYKNRVCMNYKQLGSDEIKTLDGVQAIQVINLTQYEWIGFNCKSYDHVLFEAICQDKTLTNMGVYELSQGLIHHKSGQRSWANNVIDLLEICPKSSKGGKPGEFDTHVSLKEFGHRLKYPILENLPYAYDQELTEEEWTIVKEYGKHDIRITELLWEALKDVQEAREGLRKTFGISLHGGAPKLAEKCILKYMGETKVSNQRGLVNPNNLILSQGLKKRYKTVIYHDYYYGTLPDELHTELCLGELEVVLGKGGIHGFSKPGVYENCYEYDVTSYYPSIILNCMLGSLKFRAVYEGIYNERLKLKAEGSKLSESYKLILNSVYGKLSYKWTDPKMYCPLMALNICVLGQYYLLDLVEQIQATGLKVLYLNTDGIIVNGPVTALVIKLWQERTGFKLKAAPIKTAILKDVNNCFLDYGDHTKTLGAFNDMGWQHNAQASIIKNAVVEFILRNTPIKETIKASTDPFEFCFFTKTTGAHKLLLGDEYLNVPRIRRYVGLIGRNLVRRTTHVNKNAPKGPFYDKHGVLIYDAEGKYILPRDYEIVKGYNTALAMNIADFDWVNVNYEYYIKKAEELIKVIRNES